MKYIRTKDGILTCLDTNTLKVGDLVDINEPILAKSDTIEELCDEFVATLKNTKPYIFENGEYKELEKKPSAWLGTLYGAIWTKGEHDEPILKSVAKMKGILPNREIDWELL